MPKPYLWDASPATGSNEEYVAWMVTNRGEDPKVLAARYQCYLALLNRKDLWDGRNARAFLLTPRDRFVLPINRSHSYDDAFLDIGYGVTISGPHLVARMTSSIDLKRGERVLEIGTGSGYQSAFLANLTDQVYTIEIIKPLAERTRGVYDQLIGEGYSEFKSITTKNADGYYGWEEHAPFDKIIVTCGIDHIPPPLLQQLRPNGIMVIPVGPPGAQHILKVVKKTDEGGEASVSRSDIFGGKVIPFVPLSGGHQSEG